MREYVIVTDSDTEIPYSYAEEKNIPVFLMPYTINNVERLYDLGKDAQLEKDFFKEMRDGAKATTSTRPPIDIQEFFEEELKKGLDVVYLCFSSQLSGHYNLAVMAAQEALANYPDGKIDIVDLKTISVPAALLVMKAQEMKEAGKSAEEVIAWVEENKKRACAWFVVDDLVYLKNGGRLSGTAAFFGTLLGVKPVLTVTEEGKIVNVDKIKGMALAKKYLVEKVVQNIDENDNDMYILHADCEEVALELKEKILAKAPVGNITIKMVGPVIGSHSGPGTLAVVFMKKA